MTNRTAIATLSRIEEMFRRGISYPGDLDKIEQLVLNAKAQMMLDGGADIPKWNVKKAPVPKAIRNNLEIEVEVKECVN